MKTIQLKTNINCGGCVAKVTPFFEENSAIHSWSVDTQSPNKTLTVCGEIAENQVIELVEQAGFSVIPQNFSQQDTQGVSLPTTHSQSHSIQKNDFWQDKIVWNRAAQNTLNCLIGCSIGDFGMIIYLQAFHPHTPLMLTMLLAIIAGLTTSILLETVLLRLNEKLTWGQSFSTALGMSLISMIAMEIAMNITDFMITGGKADFHHHIYWMAFGVAAIAGFIAPLPFNYFKLKKYNKACH